MELQQLKYFKKVAETGKIATAAEALFISSPALSSTISRLERELGYKLFDRHGSWIELNRQGEIFLRYVDQVFTSLECAKTELAQSMIRQSGQVSLAFTNAGVWIEMLTEFAKVHPEISLVSTTLNLSQLEYLSLSGQYSFLLTDSNDLPDTLLDSHTLFEDEPILLVHPSHPLAQRSSIDLREIRGEPLFLPMPNQSFSRRVRDLLKQASISTEFASEGADLFCRYMVMENRGIAFSTIYTDPDPDLGIEHIAISRPVSKWEHRIYWDRNDALSREAEIFRDFVIDFYKNWRRRN